MYDARIAVEDLDGDGGANLTLDMLIFFASEPQNNGTCRWTGDAWPAPTRLSPVLCYTTICRDFSLQHCEWAANTQKRRRRQQQQIYNILTAHSHSLLLLQWRVTTLTMNIKRQTSFYVRYRAHLHAALSSDESQTSIKGPG